MGPTQQERRFDRQYAHTLLRIAQEDYRSGLFLSRGIDSGEVRPENVFFLYQQAIEKLLKAVLCWQEIPVPLVHDLGTLMAKLPPHTQPGVGYEITALNEFAGVRRYEEGHLIYEPDDVEDVRTLTDELLTWAATIIGHKA